MDPIELDGAELIVDTEFETPELPIEDDGVVLYGTGLYPDPPPPPENTGGRLYTSPTVFGLQYR